MSERFLKDSNKSYESLSEEIRSEVIEDIDCSRELSDKEVLRIIDDCIIKKGKYGYISLDRKKQLREEIFCSLRRYDVLQTLIDDNEVSEIMVNGTNSIFYEKRGQLFKWDRKFSSAEKLEDIIQRIVAGTNRMVNERSPIVDTRLENGSRVNVVLSPVSLEGSAITIRRFPDRRINMDDLINFRTLPKEIADYLRKSVEEKRNILVSGGTGSGKTTFLNALSDYIGKDERVITIEDSAELQIESVLNCVRLECRDANTQGVGEINMRMLIKASLRMRPDRIIIGEVRGAEAVDLLQALNTGHSGSFSTIHANSCADVFSRLETMVLMGINIPLEAIRRQIASAIHLLVHLEREKDKSRKVREIAEITGYNNGEVCLRTIYKMEQS